MESVPVLVLAVFAGVVGFAPAASVAADLDGPPEAYVSTVLPNGLRVSVLADPSSPVVATQVWYHVGSADEDADSRGLAHLFEHLMFGATERHGAREYSDLHYRNGGDNNAMTFPDETVYVSEMPAGAHLRVVEHEADRMGSLILDRRALDNEKRIVLEELRLRTENDPYSRVLVAAQKALLGDHPYAFDPSGSKEDVAAATLDACRSFYEAHYRPDNAHLVVVGPVDPSETVEAARASFPAASRGAPTRRDPPALLGWSYPAEVVLEEDLPPVETAILGFPLPPPASEDSWAILVLRQLLAGGQEDPFEQELVRRRNKAVAAGTETLAFRRGGAVLFYAASLPYRKKKTAFRLMEETRRHLGRLEWLTDETLEGAKRALRRRELRGRYFSAARAWRIGQARWWLGDETLAFRRAERIAAVSSEQVAEVFRRYIGEPEPVRLYIKPERVPLHVRLFGWVYPLVSR